MRAGAFGSGACIGPWATGTDFGAADAGVRTRAVVALRGLLALPAREARYYTAAIDDAGRPLLGRCRYRVSGGQLPAQWWSLTLYDRDGYLTGPGPYSVTSVYGDYVNGNQLDNPRGLWSIEVGPPRGVAGGPTSLPTTGVERFELTLRLYLPRDAGRGNPPRTGLPSIARETCA